MKNLPVQFLAPFSLIVVIFFGIGFTLVNLSQQNKNVSSKISSSGSSNSVLTKLNKEISASIKNTDVSDICKKYNYSTEFEIIKSREVEIEKLDLLHLIFYSLDGDDIGEFSSKKQLPTLVNNLGMSMLWAGYGDSQKSFRSQNNSQNTVKNSDLSPSTIQIIRPYLGLLHLSSQDLPTLSKKDFVQSLDCSLLQMAQNQVEFKNEIEKISKIIKDFENFKQRNKANNSVSNSSINSQNFTEDLTFDNAKNYLNKEIIEKRIVESESTSEQDLNEIIKQKSSAHQEIMVLGIAMNAVSSPETEKWIKQSLNEDYFKNFYEDTKKITAFAKSKKIRDIELKKTRDVLNF